MKLSHECDWCAGPFDAAVSCDARFCTPECRNEATDAYVAAWAVTQW